VVFTSTVFLFLFLPLFLAVYAVLPARWRTAWILLCSYAFYAWWRPDFALVFVASTVAAYVVGHHVGRWREDRPRAARRVLALGIVLQLGTLAYFKYAEFGVASLNAVLVALGGTPLPALSIVLPIGISFYVFQAISYMVDVWRGDAPGRGRFVDVAAYIALFPQLIAGPIVRYKTIATVLESPRSSAALVGEGAQRFMLGFCKKVLIADALAPVVDGAFSLTTPTAVEAWLGVLAFAAQLFFDFSGYSDMAIGLGLILGFRFKENFDRPYTSASITEFWRRWHMSLSRWLRDYLYFPLGGNRLGTGRTYVNLLVVMLLGGLWHGAAWVFLAWGAWHGGLLVLERWRGLGDRPRSAWSIAGTFLLVLIGWVLFRSADLEQATGFYAGMLGVNGWALSPELAWQLAPRTLVTLVIAYALIWFPSPGGAEAARGLAARVARRGAHVLRWGLLPLFLLGVMRAIADSFSPFLYFRF
jgi:alginate O-acetyltransferase complex protein AlgI